MTIDNRQSDKSDSSSPNIVASGEVLSTFEAAPPLLRQRHRETISCFSIDTSSKNKPVKRSPVELRRGVVVTANKTDTVKVGGKGYLAIAACQVEPQAVGLYVRLEEVNPCPTGVVSMPVQAPAKLNLRLIKRANKAGKPIMELSGVWLSEGTVLRVSSVHRVTEADSGDGVIDADGSVDYYLVAECPQVPAAAGLFVQIPDVSPLTETDYAKEIEKHQDPTALAITQQGKITPKDGADTAALFQDISQQDKKLARKLKPGELPIVKSARDTLPADTPVVVETAITRSGEKEYYRIVKCQDNPAVVGMFLLVKEVSSILDISPPGSQQPSEG